MSCEKPQTLEASVTLIDHPVHLTVATFRGVGEGREGYGCTDEVTGAVVSKFPPMFLEPAYEKKARQEALHQAIDGAMASDLPTKCVDRLTTVVEVTQKYISMGAGWGATCKC